MLLISSEKYRRVCVGAVYGFERETAEGVEDCVILDPNTAKQLYRE